MFTSAVKQNVDVLSHINMAHLESVFACLAGGGRNVTVVKIRT